MTREEAIAFFKDMNECTYGDVEPIQMAIKALEKESMLEKIRAEIKELDNKLCRQFLIEDIDREVHRTYSECINIIDKYKAESEGEK